MASKNITLRLNPEELEFFNRRAEELGIDRTTLIKRSVKSYSGAIPKQSVPEKTKEVLQSVGVSEKVVRIADFTHPLLDLVEDKGLTIQNQEGSKLVKIKSLPALLDFVETKVLNFKKS